MEIFGIGASELIFILIIAIIVLGPRDMQKAGRTIGRWLNSFVRSDGWRALQRASQEIRRIPTHLMREANLDAEELREMEREVRRSIDPRYPSSASGTPPGRTPASGVSRTPGSEPGPSAAPPSADPPPEAHPDQE
jgi:sec-independent protein translocase protein TatB